jgi:hypothetical protein
MKKNTDIRAPRNKTFPDDGRDAPVGRLAFLIEKAEYDNHPDFTPLEAPPLYVCLNILAINNHCRHLTPVCSLNDFAAACKTIWNATRN